MGENKHTPSQGLHEDQCILGRQTSLITLVLEERLCSFEGGTKASSWRERAGAEAEEGKHFIRQ